MPFAEARFFPFAFLDAVFLLGKTQSASKKLARDMFFA
jgi:hypothetical protein